MALHHACELPESFACPIAAALLDHITIYPHGLGTNREGERGRERREEEEGGGGVQVLNLSQTPATFHFAMPFLPSMFFLFFFRSLCLLSSPFFSLLLFFLPSYKLVFQQDEADVAPAHCRNNDAVHMVRRSGRMDPLRSRASAACAASRVDCAGPCAVARAYSGFDFLV